ncbi:MAG: thioether cross-link-forming SCIFF peptide maturase, partial [Oscillospiraceae bacterium]|nr:thioether cross-link-forming SCIFF peptide maturase [Oscillospiraceae bacterium]
MVHTFSVLGCNIAVDVNSGAVHVLDKLSYQLLSKTDSDGAAMPMPDGYSDEQCKSAWAELMTLKAQGLLFSSDDYVDPSMAIIKNAPVKALCLHVSHDCNLRCTY